MTIKTILRILDILLLVFISLFAYYLLASFPGLIFGNQDAFPGHLIGDFSLLILCLSFYGLALTKNKTYTFILYMLIFHIPLLVSLNLSPWVFIGTIPAIIVFGVFLNYKRTGQWLGRLTGLEDE